MTPLISSDRCMSTSLLSPHFSDLVFPNSMQREREREKGEELRGGSSRASLAPEEAAATYAEAGKEPMKAFDMEGKPLCRRNRGFNSCCSELSLINLEGLELCAQMETWLAYSVSLAQWFPLWMQDLKTIWWVVPLENRFWTLHN